MEGIVTNMFTKISKTDLFYIVAFGLSLALLYVAMVTSA